jgi:predicted solute-binding protein
MTGLPFVWALWAGRSDAVDQEDVRALQETRDRAVEHPDLVAREYFHEAPEHVEIGARYLRENIKYYLGSDECAGLELFYRYAADIGLVPATAPLRFY